MLFLSSYIGYFSFFFFAVLKMCRLGATEAFPFYRLMCNCCGGGAQGTTPSETFFLNVPIYFQIRVFWQERRKYKKRWLVRWSTMWTSLTMPSYGQNRTAWQTQAEAKTCSVKCESLKKKKHPRSFGWCLLLKQTKKGHKKCHLWRKTQPYMR